MVRNIITVTIHKPGINRIFVDVTISETVETSIKAELCGAIAMAIIRNARFERKTGKTICETVEISSINELDQHLKRLEERINKLANEINNVNKLLEELERYAPVDYDVNVV